MNEQPFDYDASQFTRRGGEDLSDIPPEFLDADVFTLVHGIDHPQNPDEMIKLGEVCQYFPGHGAQTQYLSMYLGGIAGRENLGIGLTYDENPSNYHTTTIRAGDVEEFVRRRIRSSLFLEPDFHPIV